MRLGIPGLVLRSTPASEFIAELCKQGAKWSKTLHSYDASFGAWAACLLTKHSKTPNIADVLKRVIQFANNPDSLLSAVPHTGAPYLQDAIAKLVAPGIISARGQPHRAFVVLGVALSQLCFAYNMAPPVEIPSRLLTHSGRAALPSPMPFTDPRRHFSMVLGHDALRQLSESDVLGIPKRLVSFASASPGDLEPHVSVVPGVVWAHPSHWSRVIELIRKTATVHGSRLIVLLGGYECPFGFVRALVAFDTIGSAHLTLPDDMDCCGAPITVPAGVWSTCPVEIASAFNASVVYSLRPTDRVLVVNALQVLPCILEHLTSAGRVAHCCLALGALPPKSIRLLPLSKLTATLEARASAVEPESPTVPRQTRCNDARGIPCCAGVMEALSGALFSRSAARLDCACYTSHLVPDASLQPPVAAATTTTTTTTTKTTYSKPYLHVAGVLGLRIHVADLLFLPRVVHPCARHKCAVLLDPMVDNGTMKWIDSAWGDFQCVFTQTHKRAAYADQTLRGPTLQAPWLECFEQDGIVTAH